MEYHMVEFPQSKYKFHLFDNIEKLTMEQIKEKTKCDSLVNLGFFNMNTFKNDSALMINGKWIEPPMYHEYGICIDNRGYLTVDTQNKAYHDYAIGCPPVYINGKRLSNAKAYNNNGWTYTGVKNNGDVVVWINTKNNKMDTNEVEKMLLNNGCIHILRWDGSWSSQGILKGEVIKPSQYRCCRSWLLIYDRANVIPDYENEEYIPQVEETPEIAPTPDIKPNKPNLSNKKVVLDAGHGVEQSCNCSPDKKYFEYEFAFDMSHRIKTILESYGVQVVLTRLDEHLVPLSERTKISNRERPDLFVSLHSNASGDGKNWTKPDGFGIYTSKSGSTAQRNIAANAILNQARNAGIKIWGQGLFHNGYYVLRHTDAPAVLIEHGFHTNYEETNLLKTGEYRLKLAEVDARGILDYLGIPWKDNTPPPVEPDEEIEDNSSWDKAVDMGLVKDINPFTPLTKLEFVKALEKLNLLK